jgi:hypothetical protein
VLNVSECPFAKIGPALLASAAHSMIVVVQLCDRG